MIKTVFLSRDTLINKVQYFIWATEIPHITTAEVSGWHVLPTVTVFSPNFLYGTINCDTYIGTDLIQGDSTRPHNWNDCFSLCATLSVKRISCHSQERTQRTENTQH